MKKKWLSFALLAVGLLAILLLVFSFFSRRSHEAAVELGQIVSIQGQAENRLPRALEFTNLAGSGPLLSQQVILTHKSSEVVLAFNGGARLRLLENTRFVAEADSTRVKPSEFALGTILEGNVRVEQKGAPNSLRLFRQGREITLDTASTAEVSKITPEQEPVQPTDDSLVITATAPEETAPTPQPTAAPEAEATTTSEILTNEDILRRLRQQTGFFQRCYLGFIHRSSQQPGALTGGKVIVTFKIQPNGKVTESGVVRSDFTDVTLHKCITEVIGRTQFKAFQGAAVPVDEFPITLR